MLMNNDVESVDLMGTVAAAAVVVLSIVHDKENQHYQVLVKAIVRQQLNHVD